MDPIYVTGHRNPDTDSIVSAMAYAQMRNALGDRDYVAARLGRVSDETQLVLDHFGFEPPVLIRNLRNQVSDLQFDTPPVLNRAVTVDHAWKLLHQDENMLALPVANDDGTLYGMLSTNRIAVHDMQSILDSEIEDIPVFNLVSALEGNLVLDREQPTLNVSGRLSIALPANGEESIRMNERTILLCGNQPEVILDALRANVACVVLCQTGLPEEAHGIPCNSVVISTPHEPYRAARMIFLSAPVGRVCRTTNLCAARLSDYVDDVLKMAHDNKHRTFPVVDEDMKVMGTLSRIHLLKPRRKRVVLVDHNEVAQSVPGLEQADILEIIDHHRLADVETANPIYMRNEPVGSTATIIAGMYMERGLMPTRGMAGMITCAILSDTLMFKSPTCTPRDIQTANRMAGIAHETIEDLGRLIFSAATSEQKSAGDILFQDYKEFALSGHTLCVGQVVTLDAERVLNRREDFLAAMQARVDARHYDMLLFLITDMLQEGSHLLFIGDPDIIENAFHVTPEDHHAFLPGILSRKKQVIPALSAYWVSNPDR